MALVAAILNKQKASEEINTLIESLGVFANTYSSF